MGRRRRSAPATQFLPVQRLLELLFVHLRAPRDVALLCFRVKFGPGLFATVAASRRFTSAAGLLLLGSTQVALVCRRALVFRCAGLVQRDGDCLFRVLDLPLAVGGLEFAVLELVHDAFDRLTLRRGLLSGHLVYS